MSEFTATFWGVRGGYPVPGESTLEFGGNTTCLEVRAGPHLIIIDAGTGIIDLGEQLAAQRVLDGEPVVATMLFTHGHHDHTQGFPFFAPFRFHDSVLDIFGLPVFGEDVRDMLQRAMLPHMFPIAQRGMPGIRSTHNVQGHQVLVISEKTECPEIVPAERGQSAGPPDAVRVWVYHSSNHPKGGSLSFKIAYQGRQLVFATDTEGYIGGDTLLSRFVEKADVLIHDAEYTEREYTGPPSRRQGWGHSTWRMAVHLAKKAHVKQLVLTHHNAKHDDAFMRDLEKEAQAEFPNTIAAREGMTLTL